jgi:hypothetical protein
MFSSKNHFKKQLLIQSQTSYKYTLHTMRNINSQENNNHLFHRLIINKQIDINK